MKIETQRKIEILMLGLETTLLSLDDLVQDSFYSKKIKQHGNWLKSEIEILYNKGFIGGTPKGVDYYIGLMEWLKINIEFYAKFNELSEEKKEKYLLALSNFNTINLRK